MPQQQAVIFLPEAAALPDGFQNMVDSLSEFTVTEVVRSVGYLKTQLLPTSKRLRPIVIVVAPTKSDLKSLLGMEELFENTRLILVVADVDPETVSLGHLMRPRFIGHMASGSRDIKDVVKKMVRWSDSGQSIRERRSL